MLEKTLEKIDLGLPDKEIKVYLALLKLGEGTAGLIAKKSGLKRTTIYGILKTLKDKGLVSMVKLKERTVFSPLEPKLLLNYVDRLSKEIAIKKEAIKKVIPQLEQLKSAVGIFPKIQFFDGIEGVKQIYEDTIENNKEKMLYDISGIKAVFEVMGKEWTEYYLKKRTEAGIKCLNIAADTPESRKSQKDDKKYLRTTKLMPKEYDIDIEIDIYDNKIGLFSFSEETPIAVLVEDDNIAGAMKTIFKYIFDTLK